MPSSKYSPEESWCWFQDRLSHLEFASLNQFSESCGINRGTLSKYFHQKQRPNIDALAALCISLEVAPATLLVALGAIERDAKLAKKSKDI